MNGTGMLSVLLLRSLPAVDFHASKWHQVLRNCTSTLLGICNRAKDGIKLHAWLCCGWRIQQAVCLVCNVAWAGCKGPGAQAPALLQGVRCLALANCRDPGGAFAQLWSVLLGCLQTKSLLAGAWHDAG